MDYRKRTSTCGELRAADIGKRVTLTGWVDTRRDLGGVVFIDLRDRYGKTQVVFNPQTNKETHTTAGELRSEYVISVSGTVGARPEGTRNPNLPTGEIDVMANELTILNPSDTPPFPIEDEIEVNEEARLQYRYLDLRRGPMQRNLLTRHSMYLVTRKYFDRHGFVEIETPVLMKSTPEGARDYLVPSRIHPGKFYALPQSPQTYKQILMVAGMDRYFQIVKCFRDEDLRADRQPEFTQIDVEMSFVDEKDVIQVSEGLMKEFFKELKGIEIALPLPRLTYREAMERYGTDKPDTRFDLMLTTISDVVKDSGFRVFADTVKNGGVVAGFVAPGCGSYTRNQLDGLVDLAKKLGAGGLVWMRVTEEGVETPTEKFLGKAALISIRDTMRAKAGDLILLISDQWEKAYTLLGMLRLEIAKRLNLIDAGKFNLLWVTEFPMFEYDENEKRYVAMHHPFTSPNHEDLPLLDSKPLQARARAYDLVLNGNEIAGGSIRIHDRQLQSKVFELLGIVKDQATKKFGFMLEAFRYGAPPHGGIAFGFDRICMLLTGEKSIREVIAFPKTTSAMSLMDESPSEVDPQQLKELHIRIV
ncbi:MAG: aspartate--tRNA ligase [Ignavibacteria bacterium 13_1_40CM_2_61_4]|nr:MAG: aspartate--tRNA ligase [Ignavibacteria bacterium 13_1_40CM_2_61_4]